MVLLMEGVAQAELARRLKVSQLSGKPLDRAGSVISDGSVFDVPLHLHPLKHHLLGIGAE
jgi:hypothetical protein